jgi:UDP-glucose:(heptosyl)LPS alpha-1,3-glucosyltransferase
MTLAKAGASQIAKESSARRTITFICPRLNYIGGLERIFSEYVRYFIDRGWSVNAVTAEISEDLGRKCNRVFHVPDFEGRSRVGRFFATAFTMYRYTQFVRRHRGSLGYVVSMPGASSIADAFVAGSCHFAALASLAAAGRPQAYLNPHHWICVFNEFFAYKLSRGSKIFAPSRRTLEEIVKSYGVAPARVHLVPFGLDVKRFIPVDEATRARMRESWQLPRPDAVAFIVVANEFVRKGVPLIIECLARLPDSVLVVAGRDDPAPMQALARKLGVDSRVRFVGTIGPEMLTAAYGAADAFVFPTAYESFGMVCIEAMSCGLPVVVTRVGGIEDYVTDGVDGILVERTVNDVCAAMTRLAQDVALRRRLGDQGRATARSYDWDVLLRPVPEICAS